MLRDSFWLSQENPRGIIKASSKTKTKKRRKKYNDKGKLTGVGSGKKKMGNEKRPRRPLSWL